MKAKAVNRQSRHRRDQKCTVETVVLHRLVHVGRDDGNRLAGDHDRDIGLGEVFRLVRRMAFFRIDDGMAVLDRAGGLFIVCRQVDGCDLVAVGHQDRIAVSVEDGIAEYLAGLASAFEESQAGRRRRLAGCNLLKVADVRSQILRPILCGPSGVLVEQMIGRGLDREPSAAAQDAEDGNQHGDIGSDGWIFEH